MYFVVIPNMKKHILIFAALILCGSAFGQDSQRQRLEKHLYTLAADSLKGRKAGSAEAQKAARYITNQWDGMGMAGKWKEMPFSAMGRDGLCNYYFIIEGNDPQLKDRYIVLGAHYDHVGVKGGKIYNGADDNASGSTCLIELARQLLAKQGQLKRSVIICAFDAEEIGLCGSQAMVDRFRSTGLLDKVDLMMSIDMVGWYKANRKLELMGTGTLRDGSKLVSPQRLGINISTRSKPFENSVFTATDTEPFAVAGIPTLAVTTGVKSPYHKPEDDADLIDYDGLDLVTDYLAALTIDLSNHQGTLASGKLAPKHSTGKTFEFGLSVGLNRCHIGFPKASFDSKNGRGFQGGLTMQYNFARYYGLRADLLYSYAHSPYPDVSNPFGSGYGIEQHALAVPLMFQLHTDNAKPYKFYFNLGGFYSRVFDGGFYHRDATSGGADYLANTNQWGYALGFGIRMGNWQLDGTYLNQLNNLFDSSALPTARKNSYTVSLVYYF